MALRLGNEGCTEKPLVEITGRDHVMDRRTLGKGPKVHRGPGSDLGDRENDP
jgi:hypothetical protein